MSALKALLWDVDGTLAETELDGHRVAFNQAFEAAGLDWRWDEARYLELLVVTGGRERLLADMARRTDAPAMPEEREALARRLHADKNRRYAAIVASGALALRPGVQALIAQAQARGLRQAIVTTTSRSNVEALLQARLGAGWPRLFAAVVCGEDVQRKKPDPEAYGLALRQLGLSPLQALAIEDSPGGVAAARAADVPVVVARSRCFERSTVEGAVAIGPGFGQREGWTPPVAPGAGPVTLDDLCRWHAEMDCISQVA